MIRRPPRYTLEADRRQRQMCIRDSYDPESTLGQLFSKPVWTDLTEVGDFDICLLTNLNSPYEFYKSLVKEVGKDGVLIPSVLGITNKSEKVS